MKINREQFVEIFTEAAKELARETPKCNRSSIMGLAGLLGDKVVRRIYGPPKRKEEQE